MQVTENSEAQLVARVKLGDPDDWRQGHGPPFTISLDPRAPPHVTDSVRVKLDRSESREHSVHIGFTVFSQASPPPPEGARLSFMTDVLSVCGAGGDDGRGVGVVWTRAALDREERPALLVPLVVGDAGWPSLTATVTLTLHVADLNDNPMAPAAKTVTVHTLQVRPSTHLAAQTLNTPCRSDP